MHDKGDPAVAPTRISLVRTAKSFVDLPYLWAGTRCRSDGAAST